MKIDDLVHANDLATKWRYLMQLDRALRESPWLTVSALSIPAQTSSGVDLEDLTKTGLKNEDVNEQVRDLIAQMLDRQAALLLAAMEEIGLHTEELARDREAMIRAYDEQEKTWKA